MDRFLHDRGDYKSGWQLEKEWDREQSMKKKKLEDRLKAFQKCKSRLWIVTINYTARYK